MKRNTGFGHRTWTGDIFLKPPLIAWMIALWQYLLGEQVFVPKSLALCTHVVTTYLIYIIARDVYNREIGCYAALLFLTMPAISLSSLIISTDVFLMLLWAMALWTFTHAQHKKRLGYWVLAGIFCGLGLLTKYTMLLFFPSAILALYLRYGQQGMWRYRYGVVVASCTAVLIWAPNLWWNYTHKMAAFKHLYEIHKLSTPICI